MTNLKANTAVLVIATATVSFQEAGILFDNMLIIYEIGDTLKSYKPGRSINGISGFIAGKRYYIIAKTDLDLSAYLAPKNLLLRVPKWKNGTRVIGDSITAGYLLEAGEGWADQLAAQLGVTIVNLAISSTGCRKQLSELFAIMPAVQAVPLVTFVGFNNMRVTTNVATHYEYINAAHRSVIAAQFAGSVQFAVAANSNASFSGSAPATSSDGTLENLVSRALFFRGTDDDADVWNKIVSANETITFASINGTAIAIGTYGCDGSTYDLSRIKVTIDGVDKATYNPAGKVFLGQSEGFAEGLINDAIVITGLSSGNHSVVLTFLDGGKRGIIDAVYSLKTPNQMLSNPAFVLDLPHMSNGANVGYNYPGGETTETIIDGATESRKSNLLATFPTYSIAFVDINAAGYYNPGGNSLHVNADGIHPSALGATMIKNRVFDYLQTETI